MLFRCQNCGGNMVYSPKHGGMFCPYCDGTGCEERVGGAGRMGGLDAAQDGNAAAVGGAAQEAETMKEGLTECVNCGAPLEIGKYNSTCKCAYCGSYVILDERVSGRYRPQRILPFQIGKEGVVKKMKEEFKSRIFTPESFLSEATLEEMKGMYVPFWLYDYKVHCGFSGRGTKIRVWTSGSTEYTETSHYRVERDMDMDFDQVPVDASIEMGDEAMDLMEPFDYGQLEGFSENYMSGFYGEIYNMEAGELEGRAEGKVGKDAESLLKETVTGYHTLAQEHKAVEAVRKGVCHALLPVWRYRYQYQGREYVFYINGQTGKIAGVAPVSKKKVLAYSGTVFALVWAAFTLLSHIVEVI